MRRMTLHEAQRAVAAIYERNNLSPVGWRVNWDDPVVDAIAYAILAEKMPYGPLEKAAKEISAALLAYHAHLAFEAGRQFSDKATARHARRMAAFHVADEIDAGLHYAEEIHQ